MRAAAKIGIALVSAGAAIAAACGGSPFPDVSRVDRFRIVAITAEPPEVQPGGLVTLTGLALDPYGERRVSDFWTDPGVTIEAISGGGDFGNFGRPRDSFVFPVGSTDPAEWPALPVGIMQQTLWRAPEGGMEVAGAHQILMAATVVPPEELLGQLAPEGVTTAFNDLMQTDFTDPDADTDIGDDFELGAGFQLGSDLWPLAIKGVLVLPDNPNPNRNPIIDDVVVTSDVISLYESIVAEVKYHDPDFDNPVPGVKLRRLRQNWFVMQGELTRGNKPVTVWSLGLNQQYEMVAVPGIHPITVVVRDQKGGVAFAQRDISVSSERVIDPANDPALGPHTFLVRNRHEHGYSLMWLGIADAQTAQLAYYSLHSGAPVKLAGQLVVDDTRPYNFYLDPQTVHAVSDLDPVFPTSFFTASQLPELSVATGIEPAFTVNVVAEYEELLARGDAPTDFGADDAASAQPAEAPTE